ncbi:MAG TPA: hypothetical protein VMZ91_14345 [Candidatus Paceibacterota bacterium]|nr:hypothetical protein [Candidatus Paceibacterota bacterium]
MEDLYDKYNHTKKSDVPFLLKNYNGREFEAVKTFYFKYNFKGSANYDSRAGSDDFIKKLIENYSNGERTIKTQNTLSPEEENFANLNSVAEKANVSIKEIAESKKEELAKIISENKKMFEDIIAEKQKHFDELILRMDAVIKEKSSQIEENIKKIDVDSIQTIIDSISNKKNSEEHIELKINLDYEETDIELPKEISVMAAGTRFLIEGPNKKLLAFEIKDIFCDYVTAPGKCLKEINIQRI